MKTDPNFQDADGFYERLLDAHVLVVPVLRRPEVLTAGIAVGVLDPEAVVARRVLAVPALQPPLGQRKFGWASGCGFGAHGRLRPCCNGSWIEHRRSSP